MNTLRSLKRKWQKSMAIRGLGGTIRFSVPYLLHRAKDLVPSRKTIRSARATDLDFDQKFGLDTGGSIPLSNLKVDEENWIHGAEYQAIYTVDFGQILEEFHLRYEDYIFVDLGSGKGRAVLLASALAFKKIVGVELAEELTAVAHDNIRRFPEERNKCGDIELVCADAAAYAFTPDPLVLYLYNPFGPPVMSKIVENVIASFEKYPRRIIVLYFNPKHKELWNSAEFLKKVQGDEEVCIYDSALDPAKASRVESELMKERCGELHEDSN